MSCRVLACSESSYLWKKYVYACDISVAHTWYNIGHVALSMILSIIKFYCINSSTKGFQAFWTGPLIISLIEIEMISMRQKMDTILNCLQWIVPQGSVLGPLIFLAIHFLILILTLLLLYDNKSSWKIAKIDMVKINRNLQLLSKGNFLKCLHMFQSSNNF